MNYDVKNSNHEVVARRSVVSDSLWPHGLQHARLPCPSPSPEASSNSCSLSQWCHPTVSSSEVPFSPCLQSFPASGSFPMSWLFASGVQTIGTFGTWYAANVRSLFIRFIRSQLLSDGRPAIYLYCLASELYFASTRHPPVHYIYNTMLIELGEQERAITLDLLVRYLQIKGWEISQTKI